MSGIGVAGLMMPFGRAIAAEALLVAARRRPRRSRWPTPRWPPRPRRAPRTATCASAATCSQFVITREDKVQNVVNTESTGVGIRVIANGTWGFAATNDLSTKRRRRRPRSRPSRSPRPTPRCRPSRCSCAKTPGVGEVSWKTPIKKNAMEVPIKDKVDLLLGVNAAAMKAGAQLRQLDAVPGQRAEVLRLDRRLLHRPGRAPHLGADDGHRDRQGQRQVPHPRRPVLADGHGLRVPRRRRRRARSSRPTAWSTTACPTT